ncbi:hypothetical protein ZTR_04865 [Talaromyces verruculosus]|nr:hypothetical protein ZTR_04865 [Talaromyces verruculosus]
MSVLLETSLGDLVIDLLVDVAPKACENFLKLCKVKYYNFSPVHSVQKNFTFQTGDPIGPGSADSDGGSSIWGLLKGPTRKTFAVDMPTKLKHTERGTVSMATVPSPKDPDERLAGSQFIITLGDNLDYLDGKAAIFGKVVEGFDVLEKINEAFIDDNGRPLKDIRIRHTVILDDPYDDPPGLEVPPESPLPSKAQLATVRIADDEELDENMDEEAMEQLRREREARAQALTLEMVGDLPFADVKPPENVLFVCKLNPVTQGIYHLCLSSQILGGKLQSKSGKEEDSVAYRVSNENANTAQLKIVAGLTGMAWFLIKTRCVARRQIEDKSPRGRGHTVAVVVLTGRDVTMTRGVMTASKMGTGIVIESEIEIVIAVETDIPPTQETTKDDDDKLYVLNV